MVLHMQHKTAKTIKPISSKEKMDYIEGSIFRMPTSCKKKVRNNFLRIGILEERGMAASATRLMDVTYSFVKERLGNS